jgi:pyruvate kinase
MPSSTDRRSLLDLRERLATLDDAVRRGERERMGGWHARVAGTDYALSAANLAAYLAFRQHDVRDTQVALATLGLSSLGRLEAKRARRDRLCARGSRRPRRRGGRAGAARAPGRPRSIRGSPGDPDRSAALLRCVAHTTGTCAASQSHSSSSHISARRS